MKVKQAYTILPFFIGVFLLISCQSKQPQQSTSAVPVTVAEVSPERVSFFDQYPGDVISLNETKILPQVTGYVTGIFFQDGQHVVRGQHLYAIDEQVYRANYQQAIANLQVQEANLVKAQKDADRFNELAKHDAIARQQVDYANAALAATQKEVEAAKANVAGVSANVRFSNIYAPFNGTIGISQVKKGTSVVAGQTILNTVSTSNPIAVDFTIDQKDIFHFTELQQKKNQSKDSSFTIAFGDEVYPVPGKLSFIDRAVDPQSGTIKVRLIFPNEKEVLKPGMNTTVRVKDITPPNSTVIPYKAINESLGEFFVYVLKSDSTVSQRKVVMGPQIGKNIVIESGLQPGEKIVVEGTQNLHEGALVKAERN